MLIERLKRRSDFLEVAKGDRFHARAFTLQAGWLDAKDLSGPVAADPGSARFGITITKKVGNSVQRNRMRRRLKEALRLSKSLPARPGRDYVIVAKGEALTVPFQRLQSDLIDALAKIERPTRPKPPGPRRRKPSKPSV